MRPIAIAGLVLIVLGLAALVMGGIPYTSRDTIIDIGPITATAETEKTLRVPTVAGVVAVIGGVALIVAGGRKRG